MECVSVPNLPQKPVCLAVIDGRICKELEEGFLAHKIQLIKTKAHLALYEAISFHSDIMLHHTGSNRIVFAPGTDIELLDILMQYGFYLIEGSSILKNTYPSNIAYNVARVGKYAFHNINYTDKVLARELMDNGVELVHVNQGYTKCTVSVVNDNSLITSDIGIAKVAEKKGIDVLVIEPEEGITLPGLDRGFIGGSTGLIGQNEWAITGTIDNLKSARKIYEFLNGKNINLVQLCNKQIIDVGSIIPLLVREDNKL